MDDKAIIALFWQRSEAAVAEAAEKYGRLLRSVAFGVLGNAEDARECENDVYLAAWSRIPPQRPERLSVWLCRVARNLALDRFDYNTAAKRGGGFVGLLSELGECVPSREDTEAAVIAGETARLVSAFLRGESRESRAVFLRRYWFCDPVRAVAERFGMSESKVKSMLFRTRNRLRIYLEKEGVTI